MERARQMDASDPWVCIELSQAYAEGLQDLDRARQAAEEAVKLAPDNAQAHLSLADVCRRQRDYDQAAAEYAQAAPTLKGDFFARHWHGLMLLRAGQETEGVSHLLAALKLAQEKGEHHVAISRGFVWNEKSTYVKIWGARYFEADVDYVILDALDRLRTAPNNPVALCDLATAYANLEVYDLALRYADQCLAKAPDMLEAHFARGRALLGLGNLEEAQAEFDRVLQENPLHPRVYITMAWAAMAAGQPAKAQQYLLQHRKNYPEDDLAGRLQKQ
jgi:tetratricopeptide (TPR) repeat protein